MAFEVLETHRAGESDAGRIHGPGDEINQRVRAAHAASGVVDVATVRQRLHDGIRDLSLTALMASFQ
jgi:hypothetical protein